MFLTNGPPKEGRFYFSDVNALGSSGTSKPLTAVGHCDGVCLKRPLVGSGASVVWLATLLAGLIGEIIVRKAAVRGTSLFGFAAFAVIEVQRQVSAWIGVETAIFTFSSINKNNFRIHNYTLPRDSKSASLGLL